jgi:OmpA-OmpF porin, OOP family
MKTKVCLVTIIFFFAVCTMNAQSWLNKLGKKAVDAAQNKVENRVENKTGEATDKTLDTVEGKNTNNTYGTKNRDANATTESTSQAGVAANATPSLTSYSKYDFIPGDKVLFFEDFSQDAIGDFPADWTSNGSGEVKTINIATGNWLHMNTKNAVYCYLKDINFPANYIIEFDVVPDDNFSWDPLDLNIYGEEQRKELDDGLFPGNQGFMVEMGNDRWGAKGYNTDGQLDNGSQGDKAFAEKGKVNHVIIWV